MNGYVCDDNGDYTVLVEIIDETLWNYRIKFQDGTRDWVSKEDVAVVR